MNNKQLRRVAVFVALLATGSLLSQEQPPPLAEKEIRVKPVEFINRARRMRRSSRGVRTSQFARGRSAAESIRRSGRANVRGFTFQRVFAPGEKGFGADIMRVKPRTNYGHINHIRRVLSGYLQGAFQYKPADADVLARFLLYYNARLRGDKKQVDEKYGPTVVGSLKADNIGIARSYRGWAGRTEILMPLRKSITRPGKTDVDPTEVRKEAGKVSKKETKEIKEVIERRREEDKKALTKKANEIKKEKEDIEKRKGEVQDKLKRLEKKVAEMQKDPKRNAAEIKKAVKQQEQLKKEEQKIAKQEEVVKKEEQQVKKEQEQIKKEEQQEKKEAQKGTTDEPKKEEPKLTKEEAKKQLVDEIKKELKKQAEEKSETVVGTRILFLRVLRYFNGGHYNNELWFIDAAKDDAVFRGPFTQICGRSFLVVPGTGVLVIGYGGASHTDTEHKLIVLDEKTLDVKSGSKEYVFWRGPVIYKDDKIYAIEIYKDQHYLSRFNKDMTLDARSSEPVAADSDITFYESKIYLTGKAQSGQATTIRVLNRSDLKLLKSITPGN